MTPTYTRFHITTDAPVRAVREMLDLAGGTPTVLVLFVDPSYDLDGLGDALRADVKCPVIACTTAGALTASGYVEGGIVGAAITSDELRVRTCAIHNVATFDALRANDVASELGIGLHDPREPDRFGVLLIDGLARAEERVAALLHGATSGMPITGGSAGDNLRFENTYIYDGEHFVTGAAMFACFETSLPCTIFRFQHFRASEERGVITDADPHQRVVREIDGGPAVEAYARLAGLTELNDDAVSRHPLVLQIGDREVFARSIRAWDRGVLEMYCALEAGMVVRVGQPDDLLGRLREQLASLSDEESTPRLTIAFDCILRRLETLNDQNAARFSEITRDHPIVGFSTYGEQCNGLHTNQTMTGVCFAA